MAWQVTADRWESTIHKMIAPDTGKNVVSYFLSLIPTQSRAHLNGPQRMSNRDRPSRSGFGHIWGSPVSEK